MRAGPSRALTGLALPLALGLALLAAPAASGPGRPPRDARPPVRAALGKQLHTATRRYGPEPRQRLTAYWYAARGPRPALAIVHGGYWARDTDWSRWARRYAAAGYAVFDLSYRLDSDAPWPAQRTDVLSALRWIRSASRAYRVDPHRVLLLGSSAGGHIAAAVATYRSGRAETAGVVALSPVASPYRAWADGGRAGATSYQVELRVNAERLTGCPPDRADRRCWAVWRSADVGNDASGRDDAPMLLVHARHDWVSVRHSADLAAAELDRGMPRRDMTLDIVPGTRHGMALLDEAPVRETVAGWLRERAWGGRAEQPGRWRGVRDRRGGR